MLSTQLIWLFTLALPIACIAWTVTHEEIFLEPRNYCVRMSREGKTLFVRKSFYLFTCEYCFSHYVTLLFVFITEFTLLLEGWKGYLIAGFALVWIANIYMSLFGLLRQAIKAEKVEIDLKEKEIEIAGKNSPCSPYLYGDQKSAKIKIRKDKHPWNDI